MPSEELKLTVQRLEKAKFPEDVFGLKTGSPSEISQFLNQQYRKLVKICHPDRYPDPEDKLLANGAFSLLGKFWQLCEEAQSLGEYGQRRSAPALSAVSIKSSKREYLVTDLIAAGDIANVYNSTYQEGAETRFSIFKVARSPTDHDLLQNEARILKLFDTHNLSSGERAYLPTLVEDFSYTEAGSRDVRAVNVLRSIDGLFSLVQVKEAYPKGVDPKDLAWIWRRLLFTLELTHSMGVIHGAILPPHVLIHPEHHGLILIDWSYALDHPAKTGERIQAISSNYETWYPKEVFSKQSPRPGLDIFMAARCMIWLLGGDPISGSFPVSVPIKLQNFFTGCTLESERMRPQDAHLLNREFTELIEELWGKRKFRKFSMRPTAS